MGFASFEELRAARDAALVASDHLMLEDVPFRSENARVMAKAYRTELRDLPRRAEEIGLDAIELPDYSAFFGRASGVAPVETAGLGTEEEPSDGGIGESTPE